MRIALVADLHGNRVDLGMNKHAGILHAWRKAQRLSFPLILSVGPPFGGGG